MSAHQTSATESAEKREAILAQAIATFAEEGFRNADVQVIADKAGVGKGTVYRYFGNKEDLFWASTVAVLERLEPCLLEAMKEGEGAIGKLRAVARAYAEFFDANPQYLEIFVQERAEFRGSAPDSRIEYDRKLMGHFVGVVEEGIATGEIRPLDAERTVVALAAVAYGNLLYACYAGIDESLTELSEFAVDVFLEGLRTSKPAR